MTGLYIILAHLVGDYLLQPHWMAELKTQMWLPAILHGVLYTLPYILITQSILALSVICITHIVIDRFRLVRYLIWIKNQIGPKSVRHPWKECKTTGYWEANPPERSAVRLMIISDNTLHLIINTFSVVWL